jgi:hypothetical protein
MQHGALRIVGAALALAVSVGAATGCARRAPGPGECYDFARELIGVPKRAVTLPDEVASLVESEAVRCLTTPYDHELIACVGAGSSKRRCLSEFERRTTRGRAVDEP